VRARDEAGAVVETRLFGVTREKLGKSQNPVNATMRASLAKLDWADGNLAFRFLKEPEVGEIRVGKFDGDKFPQWIEDTFKRLRERGTKSLIIDLRGNGGGRRHVWGDARFLPHG
jgi:C-terminal processing protease CtpA/Prc